jgi:hypothetical protein
MANHRILKLGNGENVSTFQFVLMIELINKQLKNNNWIAGSQTRRNTRQTVGVCVDEHVFKRLSITVLFLLLLLCYCCIIFWQILWHD